MNEVMAFHRRYRSLCCCCISDGGSFTHLINAPKRKCNFRPHALDLIWHEVVVLNRLCDKISSRPVVAPATGNSKRSIISSSLFRRPQKPTFIISSTTTTTSYNGTVQRKRSGTCPEDNFVNPHTPIRRPSTGSRCGGGGRRG